MANPENKNLSLIEDQTELHINPKSFKESGLRELLRRQIFAGTEEIILRTNGKRVVLSSSTIHSVRNLSGENRKLFLDKTVSAMYDAEEVIIKGMAVNTNGTNKPHDPRYDNIFKEFIENDSKFSWLNK